VRCKILHLICGGEGPVPSGAVVRPPFGAAVRARVPTFGAVVRALEPEPQEMGASE